MLLPTYRQSIQDLRAKEQELQREVDRLQEQYRTDLKALTSKLQDTEERLKGRYHRVKRSVIKALTSKL